MTIPDSLEMLGGDVFYGCNKLAPCLEYNESDWGKESVDTTYEVIAHLRSLQSQQESTEESTEEQEEEGKEFDDEESDEGRWHHQQEQKDQRPKRPPIFPHTRVY
ncbi:hypothetical protein TrST_g6205 [Triparma strigata]|nr:hypothetical protein TrST_g6205 [Triparma strigata]